MYIYWYWTPKYFNVPEEQSSRRKQSLKVHKSLRSKLGLFFMKMVQDHQEIRKGPWTEQEDFQLVCFVGLFGDRRWDFIAKVSGLKVAGDK